MPRNLKIALSVISIAIVGYLTFRAISHDAKLFAQLLITGVMLGSIFALVALGWVLIYKCSGVLNLAMGELTMIGGYICLGLYQRFVTVMPISTAFIVALIG